MELEEFTGTHGHTRLPDDERSVAGAGLRAEVERRRDEVIAEDDGCFVAPELVDGQTPAACIGAIEDIIVDEGGHVDHLGDGCQGDVVRGQLELIGVFGGGESAEEDEGRAEHLAAVAFDVSAQVGDRREFAGELGIEPAFDLDDLIGEEGLNGEEGFGQVEQGVHARRVGSVGAFGDDIADEGFAGFTFGGGFEDAVAAAVAVVAFPVDGDGPEAALCEDVADLGERPDAPVVGECSFHA